MDEFDHWISFDLLNKSAISILAIIGVSGSPLGSRPERDLVTDLHSNSTPIAIKMSQEIYNITTRGDQGIVLYSRNPPPPQIDLVTDLYSDSVLAAHYDKMDPSDSIDLFNSLNT
jgi:hypothetical protein